jgi:ribosome biogenesis GTPase
MSSTIFLSTMSLGQLGWRPLFSRQLTIEELETLRPARVVSLQRNALDTVTELGPLRVTLPSVLLQPGLAAVAAVGDWVLIDPDTARVARVLERQSVIARLAAGDETRQQLIAANIDTIFVVTSCNEDFNVSRLERYFALAFDARIEPVVILTKADLCTDVDLYLDQLRATAPRVIAMAVDATSRDDLNVLAAWLAPGQTVAFIGSSGVGKSTLVNTLMGAGVQSTGGIREDDAKGRHTTTSRQMLMLPSSTWVIDTPGMRELKIGAVEDGVRAVFDDIEALAHACRFRDCTHESESGCAVRSAIDSGQLDERRFRSFQKLQREAANATRTLHERRERDRKFGRMAKTIMEQRKKERGG